MEAVFRSENFRIFSGDFLPVPGGKLRKVIGNHRKFSDRTQVIHARSDSPGQRVRDNSGRNTPEVTGSWKQYSGRKISGFFWVHSDHFPVLSHQKLVGNHRKKSRIFWPEYCFHDPVTSGVFLQDSAFFPSLSCRFLRDLVTGIFDLDPSVPNNPDINPTIFGPES